MHHKLETYSLDLDHKDGGPKADQFLRLLGIASKDVDHLATEIHVQPDRPTIEEHDVVRFLEPIKSWPAGTSGTVISPYATAMLIEISDEWGVALDFVTAPVELLEVTHPQGRARAV